VSNNEPIQTIEKSSDNIKTTATIYPHCKVEISVEASKELVQKAKKEAIKAVKKDVSLPGFRKGKAPIELIEKKHPNAIEHQWKSSFADLAFSEAEQLLHIPPYNSQASVNYKLESLTDEEGKATFSFEKSPDVPTIDPKTIKLPEIEKKEVTEKELEEAMRQMRFFHAKWEEVTDRPVQEDDYVILDIESLHGEKPEKVFSDTRFEVSKKGIADWLKELILGKNSKDTIEGVSRPDEDATEEEKKTFSPREVRVTIKKIETAILPELDDEFAKKVGAKDLEEMKDSISKMLNEQAEQGYDKDKREALSKFLIENYDFDIPETILKEEAKYRKDQILQNPQMKERFNKMSQEEKDNFDKDVQKKAKEAILLFYITRQIIKDANINISENEVKMQAMASLYTPGKPMPDPKNIPQEALGVAMSRLMTQKAQDYLLNPPKEEKNS